MTLQTTQPQAIDQNRGNSHTEQVEGVVLRDSDMTLPFLQIVQPTSSEGEAGTFYRKDTGEQLRQIEAVPLAIQPVRTKFPAGQFDRSSRPECWSDDDVYPSQRPRFEDGQPIYSKFAMVAGHNCQACEYSVRFGGSENREKGMCMPSYIVALMDASTFETYMLRLQSTNTRLVRVLGAIPHVRKAVMRLYLEKVTNDSGTWYALKATASRQLAPDEQAIVTSAFEDLRGRMAQGVDEVPAPAGSDSSTTPAQPQPEPVPQQPAPQPQPAAAQYQREPAQDLQPQPSTLTPDGKLPF